ncbi:MAG TPA: histidine kinase [Candidatus Limnocylindrales bacterium]|nr:histidine kinase [Candidatus Limnocylindrales bacterium]
MRCARAGSRCRRTEVLRSAPAQAARTPEELTGRLVAEAEAVQSEIDEIELLISQARTEAARHESRRQAASDKLASAAEKLAIAAGGNGGTAKEVSDAANTLVNVARKAALMEAQIDLLEGKRKSVGRLHASILEHAASVRALPGGGSAGKSGLDGDGEATTGKQALENLGQMVESGAMPPAVSRLVLSVQEDLRREIARQMHDGPAQSLTNIVLQAQIVERLLSKDPDKAAPEVEALVSMVQRTLEATKTFIFDVRPMVLDDLGLVPTLRKSSRDRGQRAGVKVEFESVGVDRRLPMELESGLFRIIDDAMAAHLAGKPETLALRMDWSDKLEVELTAGKSAVAVEALDLPADGAELPPALASMVEERRAAHRVAIEEARLAGLARLPERIWREVSGRAETLGIQAELLDEGARLRLMVVLPDAAHSAGLGHPSPEAVLAGSGKK